MEVEKAGSRLTSVWIDEVVHPQRCLTKGLRDNRRLHLLAKRASIHLLVVYLLKTRRTRSSIKLRPTKVSLFYRDLQVSLRPCRQERSMKVVSLPIFASCMGRISICMRRVLRLKTERGIDHITLSLLCPCHEYSVTSLISYCMK